MVGDELLRAHIWKIQIFGKNWGGGVTQIFMFFKFFKNFMVEDKLTRVHICKIQVFAKNEGLC